MNDNRYCVIMAGGNGNRFWPISRESRPKQFLDIAGSGKSFIRLTYERFLHLIPQKNILVVSLARYGELVMEEIPELPEENLLLEPYSRNTAPCLTYATGWILKRNPEATIVATPADHLIMDEALFQKTLENVMDYAEGNSALVTLGIKPSNPDTNYGYIQVTGSRDASGPGKPLKVKTFTEKPDKALAEVFFKSGEFYWNSGIFAWKASVIRKEMDKYIPEITSLFNGLDEALGQADEKAFLEKAYGDCPKISIDYGVMEKTDKAWLYPGDFGWSDIDSWDALFKNMKDKDKDGNVENLPEQLLRNDRNCLMFTGNKKKLYAIKGLEDYLVIDTEDALLICPRDEKQFKEFISSLGMPDYENFR